MREFNEAQYQSVKSYKLANWCMWCLHSAGSHAQRGEAKASAHTHTHRKNGAGSTLCSVEHRWAPSNRDKNKNSSCNQRKNTLWVMWNRHNRWEGKLSARRTRRGHRNCADPRPSCQGTCASQRFRTGGRGQSPSDIPKFRDLGSHVYTFDSQWSPNVWKTKMNSGHTMCFDFTS